MERSRGIFLLHAIYQILSCYMLISLAGIKNRHPILFDYLKKRDDFLKWNLKILFEVGKFINRVIEILKLIFSFILFLVRLLKVKIGGLIEHCADL